MIALGLAATAAVVLLVVLARCVLPVLVPFLLGWIMAYILLPAVDFLEGRGLPRVAGILGIYLCLVGLVVAAAVSLLPGLVGEMDRVTEILPEYTRLGQQLLKAAQDDVGRFGLPAAVRVVVMESIAEWERALLRWAGQSLDRAVQTVSTAFRVILAPVLAFYLLKDWRCLAKRFWGMVPPRWQGRAGTLAGDLDCVLSGFIRGQLLVALIVGALTGMAAALLGLKFSVLVGLIAGATDIIPYFGPIIGAIPALLVASLESPRTVLLMGGALVVIQQLESAVLSPLIVGQRVGLHPLWVIFAVLAGGRLAGVPGLLLAVPVAGILKVTFSFGWDLVADHRAGARKEH